MNIGEMSHPTQTIALMGGVEVNPSVVPQDLASKPEPATSLRSSISWTFLGTAVYLGCQLGILVALAKLGSPEIVGIYGLALAVTAPIIEFTNLQLRSIIATDVENQFTVGDYLGLRLQTIAIAMTAIVIVTSTSRHNSSVNLVIWLVGIAKCAESVSDIAYGRLQHQERMDVVAILRIIKGLLTLVAAAATMYVTRDVVWTCVAVLVVWVGLLVLLDFPVAIRCSQLGVQAFIQPRWSSRTIRYVALPAVPVAFAVLLSSLYSSVPAYLIELHWGARELGIFVALASLMKATNQLSATIGQSAGPRLARYLRAHNLYGIRHTLVRLLGLQLCMGCFALLVISIAGPQILSIAYGAEYARHVPTLMLLTVASTLAFLGMFEQMFIAFRCFRTLLIVWIITLAAAICLCSFLIPTLGIFGAALALLGATLIRLIAVTYVVAQLGILNATRTENGTLTA